MFAEAANCRPVWEQALKGFNVIQSQQVLEWMAEGEVKATVGRLLRLLELKFQTVPQEIETVIRATSDISALNGWFDAAVVATSLADFRQASNL